ncbi:MAG: protein kinase [Gemmatimonadales bacterium]|nr:protein kinase [Gemmatimonadales bacterium]
MSPDPLQVLRAALAGRYRFDQEIGRGGMATVWRAHDVRHDRDVAIKVLRPEFAAAIGTERFQREIHLTARLQHPNILPVFDSGEADGVLWYAMPLVAGASLRGRLEREGRLPEAEAVRLVREVAGALDYAHAQGIVHRDVKPENILLAQGHALVADFGIARAVAQVGSARLTETGMAIGTLAYMSPEQATADPAIDGRTDQYSLASVLFEMLSGAPPFAGTAPAALLARRLTEPPPPVPEDRPVAAPVRAALSRALAREPSGRFASMRDFASALLPDAPAAPSAETAAAAPPRLRRPALLALLALAAAAMVATALAVRAGRRTPAVSHDASVAVLPFENRSAEPGDVYLSDGVGDELIVRLTAVPELRVAPRSSVTRLRGVAPSLDSVARALGVAHLVTGSLARQRDSVRVNVELVDVAARRQQWALQRVVPAGALVQLVDTLAAGVASALRPGGPPAPGVPAAIATRDSIAYDHYLRGQYHFYRFSEPELRNALAEFDVAIARDPGFAAAWVGRGSTLVSLVSGNGRMAPVEALAAIRLAADTALALAPSLGIAHSLRGHLATWFEWDWTTAEREHARAVALAPRSGLVLIRAAFLRASKGELDSAQALTAAARRAEPANALMWAAAALVNFMGGRFDSTAVLAAHASMLDAHFVPAMELQSRALSRLGRGAEAVAQARAMVAAVPELGGPRALLAQVLAASGDRTSGRAILDSLERAVPDPTYGPSLARAYAGLGDHDAAFRWLDRAFRDRSQVVAQLRVDPDLAPLRSDPRFARLLRDAGLAAPASH